MAKKIEVRATIEKIVRSADKSAQVTLIVAEKDSAKMPIGEVMLTIEAAQLGMFEED